MKKPKIYINKIEKNINNNKENYYYKNNDYKKDFSLINIKEKINDIFSSDDFVYKSNVIIILKNGKEIKDELIAIKNNELILLNNDKINIDIIEDIKKAN